MDRMTTSGDPSAIMVRGYLKRLRANWPALLLPLVAAGTLGLFDAQLPRLGVILAVLLAALAPRESAKLAPFAFFGYGAYGFFLAHSIAVRESRPVDYGLVHVGPADNVPWVLPQAFACLAVGVWLLAVTGAPGGGAVRRAMAQLRGTDGQPRTVPPLLLLPVILLWEEAFSSALWFTGTYWQSPLPALTVSALIFAAGVAAVVWVPRAAAVVAVSGLLLFALGGGSLCVHWLWAAGLPLNSLHWRVGTMFYGAVQLAGGLELRLRGGIGVPLPGGISGVLGAAQGALLLGFGCALLPRLLTWDADHQLARHARALAQRVEGLTRSRTDATEVAVAELRRIERDLHDGAQARLVAVGMSLRAAEQLMIANPDAALALVAEARETSSRAIDDLRDLVRGIYPPVLADRGLADAVRALALDAVLEADVGVDLRGEPPMPVAAAVYFAVAEALTNAARHAGACAVQVSLEHADGLLRATVTDDGHGGADVARGTGLAGVERRLATFDGILAVSSPVGGPTIVAIEVPCALSSVKTSSS
jgi:signal transduction histidine kinase